MNRRRGCKCGDLLIAIPFGCEYCKSFILWFLASFLFALAKVARLAEDLSSHFFGCGTEH